MKKVDLNCDLGESFGAYKIGADKAVISYVTSANIACGFHAGDPLVMNATIKLAHENGVMAGAHPGYPDLMGFGRRNIAATPEEVKAYTLYQIGALAAFAKSSGIRLSHVKPHGAMYNMAAKDEKLAAAICAAVYEFDPSLILLGLSGSKMISEAEKIGLKSASEIFADRAYEEDGSLVARSKPGAMITDEDIAVSRVVRMVTEGKVEAISGKDIIIRADSICVHGDGEKALAFVSKIRAALTAAGAVVAPLSEVLGV